MSNNKNNKNNKTIKNIFSFENILFFLFLILLIITSINPYDRGVWFCEIIPVIIVLIGIIFVHKRYFKFSNISLFFMSFFLILHTIGAHYTFENVPFDFITNLFNFSRNHFDRIAHFSVGFYAYPIIEILHKKKLVKNKFILFSYAIFTIIAIAGLYELFEWVYAILADPSAGILVLGSQGDIWDAQKDILSDTLGAIFVSIIYKIKNCKIKLN